MKRRDFFRKSGEVALYSYLIANGLARAQENPQWPLYELTQKQMDFIKKSEANEYLWKYRDLFFKNAENIRKGKLRGSPLEDMLSLMKERKIFPQSVDIKQWSLEYGIVEDEITNAFGVYSLEIIDGKPKLHPTQKGLILLRDTGLLDYINEGWEYWFGEEKKEELRIERQSGKQFGREIKYYGTIPLLEQFKPETTLGKYLIKQEIETGIDSQGEIRPILGAAMIFIDNRLFEEIPQKYKLVKHPVYTKLVAESKPEVKR